MVLNLNVLILCLAALHWSACNAQTACTGTLTGTFADITVGSGANCVLDGVTVTGSVQVTGGGILTTIGATQLFGSLEASSAGNILLGGTTTVSGSVKFSDSTSSTLEIGQDATVTSVSLENSGNLVLRGTTGNAEIKNSGMVDVLGGSTTGGGLLVTQGTGDVILCDASITGGISFTERMGDLSAETSVSCGPSTITGSINVEKGTGDVVLTGATITNGDFGVVEQTGRIEFQDSAVSDVKIEKSTGPVVFTNITTDSDVGIKENGGSIQIFDSSFSGDVGIELNGAVEVRDSTFGMESASFKLNTGPVTFTGNSDVSISLEENDIVEIRDNTIVGASITKNTGGVSIVDNTFSTVSCVDNSPAPTGTGNTVLVLADGQCDPIPPP